MAEKLFDQDFKTIREALLRSESLFEDETFPANDSSVFFNQNPIKQPFKWQRPDLSKNPKLFVDGVSRFDVKQGALGDCWMLASLDSLTLHPHFLDQVVPRDQSFSENYAGIFHFRFWQYSRWVDVVIDDRLPTYEEGGLVFLHSSEKNEFWSALLEKAYAKLHGSYESLSSGFTTEGMQDFTGGLCEEFELSKSPPSYDFLLKVTEFASLLGCSIEADENELEAKTSDGLVKGHAYSITKVQYVDVVKTDSSTCRIPLLRIRNPWGNDVEWTGPWSDKSPEWNLIPRDEKEDINLKFRADGEFWMSFPDFLAKFTLLEICYLSLESCLDESVTRNYNRHWQQKSFEGRWDRNSTAGGNMNNTKTFYNNPQYIITLEDPDDDENENSCALIISLMQKNHRTKTNQGVYNHPIGFALFKLPSDISDLPKPLTFKHLHPATYVEPPNPSVFQYRRDVIGRFHVPPGSYCIVPSTFHPNEEAEFILRVFSMTNRRMEQHDDSLSIGFVDERILELPKPGDENSAMKMSKLFFETAGADMAVNWMELKLVLDSLTKREMKSRGSSLTCGLAGKSARKYDTSVSKDACRSMIALMDTNNSGTLGFEEFKTLWAEIKKWKNVFRLYAVDVSKGLSAFELRKALNSAGYRFNSLTYTRLVQRYSTKDGMITFDDFLMCAINMKAMIDIFQKRDPNKTQQMNISLDEWITYTMFA